MATVKKEEEIENLLLTIDELRLDRYQIVGDYVRFDNDVRNSLKEFKLKIVQSFEGWAQGRISLLLWGPPGSGKTFLVQQIAKILPESLDYKECNLAQIGENQLRSLLQTVEGSNKPCLCFIDEVDSKPSESWPYEALLPYLEPSKKSLHHICFVLAGSGGASLDDMKSKIAVRPKGKDLLSRVLKGCEFTIPPLGVGDKLIVAAAQIVQSAAERGHLVKEVEKLALYYIVENERFSSARQLRGLAVSCAERIPPGEDRVKYDYLFAPGEPENKEFWMATRSKNLRLEREYITVHLGSTVSPDESLVLDKHRLAILPFVNMSPNPRDEYFADGITEELISTVSRISNLSVISRTSSMHYKNSNAKVIDIGHDLNVGTILEGSVRKSGERVRIAAQLVDVQMDKQIWTDSYDRELKDLFAIQSDIAQRVADVLRVTILAQEAKRIERKPTQSATAYNLYLKGRYLWSKREIGAVKEGTKHFEQAVKEDPRFALGYVGQADCALALRYNWDIDIETNLEKARMMAAKALEIDDGLAEAHATMGEIARQEYDNRKAEEELRKAIELKPNYATAHHWYAAVLYSELRWDEGLDQVERALDLDPWSPQINLNHARFYHWRREYPTAVELYGRVIAIDPNFVAAHWGMAMAYGAMKMYDDMKRELSTYVGLIKEIHPLAQTWAGAWIAHFEGDKPALRSLVSKLEADFDSTGATAYGIGCLFLSLDMSADGFEWLERAYSRKEGALVTIKSDPELDSFRSDPRYIELLSRMGMS